MNRKITVKATSMAMFFLLIFVMKVFPATDTVNLSKEYQKIRGFGGMNGWYSYLTTAQGALAFGNGTGQLGLSIMRMRISPTESQFSSELAMAQTAKSYGAILIASPWTPAASMKTNSSTVGGYLSTSSYSAYAAHLKSFCDYMSNNGAELYAVSIQNEPDITVSYESCYWTASQMVNFLKNNAADIGSTKIIVAESFQFKRPITDTILNDSAAASKVSIIGGHIYGGGLYEYPLAEQKGKDVWMTEHIANDTTSKWSGSYSLGKDLHDCMVANFNAYVYWMIRRFYSLIDESSNITKRGYVFSQYSKFVRPGFVRIGVPANPSTNVYMTAYKSDTSVVIVVINNGTSASSQSFLLTTDNIAQFTKYTTSPSKSVSNDGTISVSNRAFTVSFEDSSVTTLVGKLTSTDIKCDESMNKSGYKAQNILGNLIDRNSNAIYFIYDLSGKAIKSGNADDMLAVEKILRSGTYILNIREAGIMRSVKIVKE
jgi:glucuronoarabinoxylan endo-1,4-beta-xylanase